MKKYMTPQDRLEEAETLTAALAIVRTAGLELDGNVPILPPEFVRYLIAPDAYLLVVPSTTGDRDDRPKVATAMRMSRSDAVIVRISRPRIGPKRVILDIGIDGPTAVWYNEYRPCSLDGVLHFVPDHEPDKPIFRLTPKGLTASVDLDMVQPDER